MQPENVALVARIQYYRVYFEKAGTDERIQQEATALDWVYRALMRDPQNPELQIKLADLLALEERYGEAVAIMEKLERSTEAPQFVQQWLGYYLLFVDDRQQEAIDLSLDFHKRFPDETAGLFNAACGYAQLFEKELQNNAVANETASENRTLALKYLAEAIKRDSDYKALAIKQSRPDEDFASLVDDPEFLKLTGKSKAEA